MPHTLLLADDSVTIQRVIELTFADEDVQVVAVSDGEAAIAALDRTLPDIVLADVGMPGRSGYEVAEHVRQTPRLAHIPVVLLTGAFEPVDQERAAAAGCDGILAKPFEPQLVIGRVKELLARPRQAGVPLVAAVRPPITPPKPGDDDYFERLDQAFANIAGTQPPAAPSKVPIASAPAADDIDWFSTRPDVAPPAQLSYGSRKTDFAHAPAPAMPVAHAPRAQVSAPAPAALTGPPPLADAFSALLAAEQAGPSASAMVWPVFPVAAPTAVAGTQEVVEQVTRLVLERLSDRVVRETVAEIVSDVAERLIKEEIARIKAHIK